MNYRNWSPKAAGICRVCANEATASIVPGEHATGGPCGVYLVRPPEGWIRFSFADAKRPTSGLLCGGCHLRPIADVPRDGRSIGNSFRVRFRGKCYGCSAMENFPPEWLPEAEGQMAIPATNHPLFTPWRELRLIEESLVCFGCLTHLSATLKNMHIAADSKRR